jgi:hypothetical protein
MQREKKKLRIKTVELTEDEILQKISEGYQIANISWPFSATLCLDKGNERLVVVNWWYDAEKKRFVPTNPRPRTVSLKIPLDEGGEDSE